MKKIICLMLACLMLVGMLGGCSSEAPNTTTPPTNSSTKPTTPEDTPQTAGPVSIGDLKNKYGETDAGKLLPMYNLAPNEPLTIALKYTPSNDKDVFSIHTDEKCLDASKIAVMVSPSDYNPTGPKTYEVKPIMAPLANAQSEGLWGGVSTYYIKFNYDVKAEIETKLEEPVIMAFSIQSPADIPNTSYTIENGCFKLTWTPVEGATAYRIYQRQIIQLMEDTNIAPSGKEEGFAGAFPLLVKEVSADTLSFSDWLNDGKGGKSPIATEKEGLPYINSYQNQGVNGEYYVTAIVDGKESLFSMGVNTANLQLPKEFADGSLLYAHFKGPEDLPQTIAIKYLDGTVRAHKVYWESIGNAEVKYTIENTDLVGAVTVQHNAEYIQPEPQVPDNNTGFVAPENKTEQNAPMDVPTINDGTGSAVSPENPSEGTETPTEPSNSTEPSSPVETPTEPSTLFEQQVENTDEVLKEANQELVTIVDGMTVTASSAAEEYLAWCMVNAQSEISLAAFPELQTWATLSDVLCEVVYQNPLILGVRTYSYHYDTMMLMIEYDYTAEEIQTRQEEILAEAESIIKRIIKPGMTDAEKRRAIYDYLEANTTYDDAACEDAMNNNFQGMNKDYRDSFSTYGILVKKTGVCQSYAYAFDYLCELAGVNCIIVTGDMMGYLPHAWNKVEVNGEWLVIDVTNNEKSMGVEDFMYENPDAIAYALGYVEDDLWYTVDDNNYHSTNVALSKYKDCIITSTAELDAYLREHAKAGAEVEFIATYAGFDSDDVVDALTKTEIKEIGNSMIICGYVWFEVIA